MQYTQYLACFDGIWDWTSSSVETEETIETISYSEEYDCEEEGTNEDCVGRPCNEEGKVSSQFRF